jgi:hypothetical protein
MSERYESMSGCPMKAALATCTSQDDEREGDEAAHDERGEDADDELLPTEEPEVEAE